MQNTKTQQCNQATIAKYDMQLLYTNAKYKIQISQPLANTKYSLYAIFPLEPLVRYHQQERLFEFAI